MFGYFLKMGLKHIFQTPVLSGFILLAIALGIGVSMTMISFYSALAYNPAEEKSAQLFAVQLSAYGDDMESWGMDSDGLPQQLTYTDVMNLRSSDLGVRQTPLYQIGPVVESRRPDIAPSLDYRAYLADRDVFAMFGLEFVYGAPWDKEVDQNGVHLAVISEALNTWLFGEGNNVGKTFVMIDGETEFTVVGITKNWNPQPKYYDLTSGNFSSSGPAMFIPFALTPMLKEYPQGSISAWKDELIVDYGDFLNSEYVWLVYWVELKEAAAKARFETHLAAYAKQQNQMGRFQNPDPRGSLRDVQAWLTYNNVIDEDNRVMVGLSLLFLLVCLVNTIGLLLAKFMKKMNEAGIRRALGASRGQIFMQYLVEVGLLGALGGVLGLVLCAFGLMAVRSLYGSDIAQLDLGLIVGAVLLALVSTLLTGLFPAYRVCSANPSIFLKAQ